MTTPLLTPTQARKVAHDHARRIVDDIDGRGFIDITANLTLAQEQKLIEAIEHDLRESLEHLRLSEEDGA